MANDRKRLKAFRFVLLILTLLFTSGSSLAQDSQPLIEKEIDTLDQRIQENPGNALGLIREIYYRYINHDVDSAISYAHTSLQLSVENGDQKYEAYSLADLSNAYFKLGDFEKAFDCILKSIELSSGLDSAVYGYSLFYLANAYNELYLDSQALENYSKAEKMFTKDRNKWLATYEILNIRQSNNDTTKIAEGIKELQQRLPPLYGDEYQGYLYHYLVLAMMMTESGYTTRALQILDTIKQDVHAFGSNFYLGLKYYNYALIAYQDQDLPNAVRYGENALEYFTVQKENQWSTRTLYFLSSLYRAAGDLPKAYTALYDFEQKNRSVINARQHATVSRLLDATSEIDKTQSELLATEKLLSQRQLFLLITLFLLVIVFILLVIAYRSNLQKNIVLSRLDSINRDKNKFMGIVSHDLRSPLNSIMMLSDIMTGKYRELKKDEIGEYASLILQSSKRMEYLIHNMLDASRIENGDTDMQLQPVDIAETARYVYQSIKILGEEKSITTHLHLDDDLPMVTAEPNALIRILENLISNAYKFSAEDSIVDIRVQRLENSVGISVIDQGPGISDSDRNRLFVKYGRLSNAPTSHEISTGLGLFIVKNLVDQMNGQIFVESETGKGSTFRVVLNTA